MRQGKTEIYCRRFILFLSDLVFLGNIAKYINKPQYYF